MKSIDVVVVYPAFKNEDGTVDIGGAQEILAFESRQDAIHFLEVEKKATTSNGAYWDKQLVGGYWVRYLLRPTMLKEDSGR